MSQKSKFLDRPFLHKYFIVNVHKIENILYITNDCEQLVTLSIYINTLLCNTISIKYNT